MSMYCLDKNIHIENAFVWYWIFTKLLKSIETFKIFKLIKFVDFKNYQDFEEALKKNMFEIIRMFSHILIFCEFSDPVSLL